MHEFQIDIPNFYLKKLNDKWLLFYACKSVQNYQILGSQLIVLTRDARTRKFVLEPYTRTFLTGYKDILLRYKDLPGMMDTEVPMNSPQESPQESPGIDPGIYFLYERLGDENRAYMSGSMLKC